MEHIRKIMEIMDDDEMFPTRNEWAYVKISNELKKLHFKVKELSRFTPATIDPSAPPPPTPRHKHKILTSHTKTNSLPYTYTQREGRMAGIAPF